MWTKLRKRHTRTARRRPLVGTRSGKQHENAHDDVTWKHQRSVATLLIAFTFIVHNKYFRNLPDNFFICTVNHQLAEYFDVYTRIFTVWVVFLGKYFWKNYSWRSIYLCSPRRVSVFLKISIFVLNDFTITIQLYALVRSASINLYLRTRFKR